MGTIVEDLQTAKVWLLEHEWEKGRLRRPDGGAACAIGALWPSPGIESGLEYDLLGIAQRMKYLNFAARRLAGCEAYTYNDLPSTTFNDIISLYDEAILLAKEEGV